jgi:hypothetical protein
VTLRPRSVVVGLVIGALCGAAAASAQTPTVTTVGDRGRLTVLQLDGGYDVQADPTHEAEFAVRQAVAREFLRTHADDYDFLVVFTRFPFDLGAYPNGDHVRALYFGVRNDVRGIGQEVFDSSSAFGSAGRLQGYIDMGPLAGVISDPTDPGFSPRSRTSLRTSGAAG